MHYTMTVDQPIDKIADDWDFLDEKIVSKFSAFREVGQNVFGIRRRAVSHSEIIDPRKGNVSGALELGPKGIMQMPHHPLHVHVTVGGTPHRVAHSFGFWHVNDMDELYLPLPSLPGDPFGHAIVIMQTPRGEEGESFAWYCLQCLTLHFEQRYPSGVRGLKDFWRAEDAAIRDYNGEERNRTCPECGYLNPLAYSWNQAKDTPEQRAARAFW
ncbi:MAG TPA: hypothetical protein VN802_10975 [Stellaceae bacterium]|nr:hypothetical protein [Stellaceae bacterium]